MYILFYIAWLLKIDIFFGFLTRCNTILESNVNKSRIIDVTTYVIVSVMVQRSVAPPGEFETIYCFHLGGVSRFDYAHHRNTGHDGTESLVYSTSVDSKLQ